jgi:hypothetical protein
VPYAILSCHGVARELRSLPNRETSTETNEKLETVYSNKTVGPSIDCNPETAATDKETVSRECRMTLKEIQNTMQILFKDVTNLKIWAKLVTRYHGSAIQAQRKVFYHTRQKIQLLPLLETTLGHFNTITNQNVRLQG